MRIVTGAPKLRYGCIDTPIETDVGKSVITSYLPFFVPSSNATDHSTTQTNKNNNHNPRDRKSVV